MPLMLDMGLYMMHTSRSGMQDTNLSIWWILLWPRSRYFISRQYFRFRAEESSRALLPPAENLTIQASVRTE